MEYITKEVLKEWGACQSGIDLFCEHFESATLQEIAEKCIELNENDNAIWLFNKCRELKIFEETTTKGYMNSGYRNSGYSNSGNMNSGYRNSGHSNSGHSNSGYRNSGHRNSGNWNSGNWNSGYSNSGNWNSGYRNSGNMNSGHSNSGHMNSGNMNSGHSNSGGWNSCDNESGFFNSKKSEKIMVFNNLIDREIWEKAEKPNFIYNINLIYWVSESDMTEEEKKEDPGFYARGGQLRKRKYKEAWSEAYKNATKEDIELLKSLPNFDADVFEEITGIRVD